MQGDLRQLRMQFDLFLKDIAKICWRTFLFESVCGLPIS